MKEYIITPKQAHRCMQLFFVVLLYALFLWSYETFLVPFYEYMGFDTDGVTTTEWVVSIGLFLLSCIHFFVKTSSFIRSINVLVQVFLFLPNLILWMHKELPVFVPIAFLLLIFLLCWEGTNLKVSDTTRLSQRGQAWVMVGISLLLFLPFLQVFRFHWDTSLLLMGKRIYEIRSENMQVDAAWVGYLFSPYVKVLLPVMIGYGYLSGKKGIALLGAILLLLMFSLSPHKSILFTVGVVLFFALIGSYYRQMTWFLGGLVVAVVTGAVLAQQGELMWNSLLVRRTFFLPAYLNYAYLEFFEGEQLHYAYGALRHFSDYPLPHEPSRMIGQAYFGSTEVNANNGFLSDAYINFGIKGVAVALIVFTLLIKFIDALKVHPAYFGLFFLMIFTFVSSGFLTAFVTHGVWMLLAVSLFFIRGTLKGSRPKYETDQ